MKDQSASIKITGTVKALDKQNDPDREVYELTYREKLMCHHIQLEGLLKERLLEDAIKGTFHIDTSLDGEKGQTLLTFAAMKGDLEHIKLLVSNGANIHIEDKWGNSVIMMAAYAGQLKVMKYLFSCYSDELDTEKINKLLYNALIGIYADEKLDIVKYICNREYFKCYPADVADNDIKVIYHPPINYDFSYYGEPLLSLACRSKGNALNIVKYLVEKGSRINLASKQDGRTPLMVAAAYGNRELIRYLIDNGADLSARSRCGYTVMDYALHESLIEP